MAKLLAALLCLVMLTACAAAQAQVRPPSLDQPDLSGELGKRLNYLCLRQLGADCRDRLVFGGDSYLKEAFTQAKPGQQMHEHQVRPLAVLCFASASLLTFGDYDEHATGISRREMARICASLIRELAAHHVSNTDKGSWWWGGEWQSAYWTALAGQGAWIMWNRLPKSTQRLAANMISFEADRFLGKPAPHNEFSDTKAEENAWNSEVMVLAACMMPEHPRRAAWDDKAKEYMITALATPQDVGSNEVIDGKPLKDWVVGPNVHSDFTLENHGFFHPDYTSCYYLNMQNLPVYALAGEKAPQGMFHNVEALHDVLDFLTLPNGWTFYPQCTDWNNYRHDVTIMAQSSNPVMPSAIGARCLRWGLDFVSYADSLTSGQPSPNLFRGQNFNCCPLDTMTHVYLIHYLFGPGAEPLTDDQAREALSGTRLFGQGKVVLCRSNDSMASFSWFDSGKRLMACVTPMASDCLALPKYRSLIGTVGGKIDDARIVRHETELLKHGGFLIRAHLQRGPELALNEKVMMVALPDGRVIWAEWFANQPAGETEVRASLVYLENNPFWLHGTKPKLYHPGGTWEAPTASLTLHDAQWLNVSDRFGMVIRGSRAICIEDGQLVLNYRPASGGDIAPCSVVVFYPNADRAATTRASKALKISGLDGGIVTVDLGDRQVELDPDTPQVP